MRQLYGLIFIGSTTAFSAMVSAAIIFQQTSCIIPQAELGTLGPFINATAVAWVVFLDVLYCFPVILPVTAQNMSYVSIVSAGLVLFVIALWFTTKCKSFRGPNVDYELMEQRRLAAVGGETHGVEVVTKSDSNSTHYRGKGTEARL